MGIVIETENKQKMDEQNKENKENRKKKYKAKRTLILSDSEDNNEEYEDVPIEMNEQCVVEEVDNQDIDSNASRKLKKRSYSEENTISDPIIESPIAKEPPLKKRKFEETKQIIMDKGVDLFVEMLENGNEEIQNALVDLVQQFKAN